MRPLNDPRKRRASTPVPKTVRLDTRLGDPNGDYFYTGFSGSIEDGGLFAHTYRRMPLYTPVDLTMRIPDGILIRTRGVVEWIREQNDTALEMRPGVGIRLGQLGETQKKQVETYINTFPPMFLDNSTVTIPDPSLFDNTDDIELLPLSIQMHPGWDLGGEQRFIAGIARDVGQYLKNRVAPTDDGAHAHTTTADRFRIAIPSTRLTVKVRPPLYKDFFKGGFTDKDGTHRIFICMKRPLPPGSPIRLRIAVPNGTDSLDCAGDVKWTRNPNPLLHNPAIPPGMGVVVRDIDDTIWHQLPADHNGMVICESVV